MIKVINGKKYDTNTAKELTSFYNEETGFRYLEEALYRKKTGEYFIYGNGGALTKYRVPCDNDSWSGSCAITPITQNEAKAWVEEHCSGEEYIEIFGDVEE